MKRAAMDVPRLIVAPRRDHSHKPDEQYERIARLYPDGRRLELFARRQWPGWDVFGNQVAESIVLPKESIAYAHEIEIDALAN